MVWSEGVLMDNPDFHAKQRIEKWMQDTGVCMYGGRDGEVDDRDIEALLLRFEKFLAKCEAERQRA